MKTSLSIKSRLTLWYLLVTAILLVVFSMAAYFLLERNLHNNTTSPWNMHVAEIEFAGDGSPVITGFVEIGQYMSTDNSHDFIEVSKRYSRDELIALFEEEDNIYIGGVVVSKDILDTLELTEDEEVRFYTYIDGETAKVSGMMVVTQLTALPLRAFRQVLVIIIPFALLLAGIFGYLLAKRSLRPVRVMAQTAQAIEGKNLNKRLDVSGNDELGELAATLNHMLARLESAFEREKQFTADASHELRTPLATVQAEATLALGKERSADEYRRSMENIYQETERMSSILQRLLFLARHEDSRRLEFVKINLKWLLADLKSDIEILCEDKSIGCHLQAEQDLFVNGDRISLRALFFNLIENAVRYTPQGGEILVLLTMENGKACVAIKDNGIGISEEHLSHIFERFYRVDRSRSRSAGGAGLGLAICRQIVELHNGAITVKSKVDEGSTFIVCLPRTR